MSTATLDQLTLTEGQQKAMEAYTAFLMDPSERVFVLGGYSGTGKSTLVRYLLPHTKKILQTIHLVDPDFPAYDIELTATTNKAAENLELLTKMPVRTIHSFLGLRVSKDYHTRATMLTPAKRDDIKRGYILFIDEASWVDGELLHLIFQQTADCKIIFMGDPAQLLGIKADDAPVFKAAYPSAYLTEVVRAADGGPIERLSTQFRHTVTTGTWSRFTPDGNHVQHLPRDQFEMAIVREFNRPDWKFRDSKVLAWTNQRVNDFNSAIRGCVKGSPSFEVGDYVVCNSYVQGNRNRPLKTDEMVHITKIGPETEIHEVKGHWYEINHLEEFFGPLSLDAWKRAEERLKSEKKFGALDQMDRSWIDLRAAYACTVDKSQGSTFDRVFIDLDDIGGCRNADRLARMLYVSTSRAREQVIFTGDI